MYLVQFNLLYWWPSHGSTCSSNGYIYKVSVQLYLACLRSKEVNDVYEALFSNRVAGDQQVYSREAYRSAEVEHTVDNC
jgi:hypothetical protein